MKRVKLFGILNVTPDSFSDGGMFADPKKAKLHAEEMFADGADYVDIGGQSTRPGGEEISWEAEWGRVEPVLRLLRGHIDRVSLDTKHWQTAQKFLTFGGRILNDVSGFQDPKMQELAPKFDMVIVNHFPLRLRSGTSSGNIIEEVHEQEICSIEQVRDELLERKEALVRAGVNPLNIVLDPGIGFGKTMELNWELLEFPKFLPEEKIMIGYSRKRFLGEERFQIKPNLEAGMKAVRSGAAFLRIHDVAEHKAMVNEQ